MNENEKKAFAAAFDFYQRWRETIIETDEQWEQLTDDYEQVFRETDADHCQLALRLLYAVMDAIGDLYSGGMKPVPANYFGRDDL